jgi:hypothetical protein
MFSSTEGAEARERYIQALGRGAPIFVEYDFVEGRVLLRLSNKLTPNQTSEYAAALIAAVNAPYCRGGRAPEFILGFAALKAQIGTVMGDPVECEHANPENGDAIQNTTTGLSFFRKSTNTPTFTNGSEHWGLTPGGLVFWTGDSIDPPPNAAAPLR